MFDTDILIWVLRGHPGAIHLVERAPFTERKISAISYLELIYGCRDQVQLRRLNQHITSQFAQVLPLSEAITDSAKEFMERFAISRHPGVNDVLIAATALNRGEVLATANRRHFDFIPGLEIKSFRP
jgi:predicted nucleic acid-binding protein